MMFLAAKALHILAMVVWVSGMLFVPIAIRSYAPDRPPADLIDRLARVFRSLCTPAMIAVWGFGLFIASSGSWLASTWLLGKIAIVLGLSGLHGFMAGQLRRAAAGGPVRGLALMHIPVLLLVLGAITLAVFKPL